MFQNLTLTKNLDYDDIFLAMSVPVEIKNFLIKITAIYTPKFINKLSRNEIYRQLKIILNFEK